MDNAFILFFVSLWHLVDVTEEIKSVSVMEGDSVTLHTDITEVQKYLLIQWMLGNSRIAEASKLTQTNSTYDGPDGRFRDRLYLDEIGSLTITNTRITDSGIYKLTLIRSQTSYRSFNVTVYVAPQSTSSPESSSNSNFLSSPYALNNPTINQTEDANSKNLNQSSSDHIHCCGFPEIVIRLVVSAVVSVAAVAFLVYDIRSTRNELNWAEETRRHQQMHAAKSHQRYEPTRRISSRYVC
ncbi:immunoglobulin domain-containing protein [Danio aesculapii]|uniref:immunoglobulin domain-containing protein n=1 Tax=Danio aesculapii TaxID=1142201 RepID=UPI0024BF10A0|nr:immunoglobulin domain-containing protein [Danio aesculapii]